MSDYKKGTKQKLRFITPVGLLSIEQLWDLKLEDLDKLAVILEKKYKESGKKSFLEVDSKKDKEIKLKFNIVLDILETKVNDKNRAAKAYETRKHNEKIDALIAAKEDENLSSKSIEELEKLRK